MREKENDKPVFVAFRNPPTPAQVRRAAQGNTPQKQRLLKRAQTPFGGARIWLEQSRVKALRTTTCIRVKKELENGTRKARIIPVL